MSQRLENQVALVTGGASGIGAATVARLLTDGALVMAVDMDADRMAQLETSAEPGRLKTRRCDVRRRAETEATVQETLDTFGRLDVLINSAGISRRNVRPEADFEEAWDAVMEVNLKGTLLMSHAAVQAMRRNTPTSGAIVNLGSIMSFVSYTPAFELSDGFNPYPHSKGGVVQMTRDMGVQLAPEGIRVNAVCPGFIDTPLTESLNDDTTRHAAIAARHPMGRFGTATEIANVVAFLASPEASFVTAETWRVDGGYVAA